MLLPAIYLCIGALLAWWMLGAHDRAGYPHGWGPGLTAGLLVAALVWPLTAAVLLVRAFRNAFKRTPDA